MIADDVEINRSILKDFFCEQYDTLLAEDGEQAISLLQEYAAEIALIILDIMMPKKNGFEVMQYMKEARLTGNIPIIVITGSNDYQDELRAYNFGVSDIIHKPFVPQIVLRRAENVMELFEHRADIERRLEQSKKDLVNAQTYDNLTGLYNMQHFLEKANEVLRKADEDNSYSDYYFVYNNIRHFKYHNLNYGTDAGNRVLKSVANKIREARSEGDLDSRFGSDHMVSLLKKDEVMRTVQEVSAFFNREYGKTGMVMKIGVYQVQKAGETASFACDLAKIACDFIYSSNEEICIYNDDISRQMNLNTYVLQHFDEAIEQGYIKVYYQPVIRTISGALCGMEALARWIDPVMGFLSPADFISVLENNHLISKLDLYMLRTVCKEMKEMESRRERVVPVSFNLSRTDFIDGDIFQEIEDIIEEYDIARDMINIEITESIVMENPSFMRNIIDRFRNVGYQVWMDDFGSGYSSLNVLKDYIFDEIKLDMKFLSSFDDDSKKIIESVILMAKKLGIQTLAEGVETQEQFDYLKSIGCEKAQGYLFSKPQPIKELYANCISDKLDIEKRGWRSYFNSIGMVNFITDRALGIVEYDGTNFRYLFVNPAFHVVWESLGVLNMGTIYDNINSVTSPLSRQFRDLGSSLHAGEEAREIIYSVRGQYVRLNACCIAEMEDHSVFDVEITNLSGKEADKKRDKLDNVFRMMYALYDSVYLVNLQTNHFETLITSNTSRVLESEIFHERQIIDPVLASMAFIHPSEQKAYLSFTDLSTLIDRLRQKEKGYITEYYRTKTANGAFVWKAHTILYVSDINSVIYCTRDAYFGQAGLLSRIAPEYLIDTMNKYENNIHQALRQGMMESKTINLFWKDTNRRFLGANEKFLQTYGFKDLSAIVGKTDEDMGWHIDGEPFENDEWRVLKNGDVIVNRIGKCIIKGVEHNIMACKEPMYQNGRIIGLIGMFLDIDTINEQNGLNPAIGTIDPVTGLLSASGVTNAVSEYAESWTIRGENFAVLRIFVPEYYRAGQTYGETIAKMMLHEVGEIISSYFHISGTCARLFAGNFVALMKCTDKTVVRDLSEQIINRLRSIRTLAGYAATIHPRVDTNFADEVNDIHSMIGLAAGGSIVDVAERKRLEERLDTYDLQLQTVVNAIPGGVVLHEVFDDGSYRVIYASGGLGDLSGRTIDEIKRDLNKDNTVDMIEADIPYVQHAVQEALHGGKPLNVSYRIYGKAHQVMWLNMKGRVIGEQNGHPLMLSVFQNLSEATKSYERALDEAMVSVFIADKDSTDVLYVNKAGRHLLDELFSSSAGELFRNLLVPNVPYIRSVLQKDVEFEIDYQGEHLIVRLIGRPWNGRDAVMCFITNTKLSPQ